MMKALSAALATVTIPALGFCYNSHAANVDLIAHASTERNSAAFHKYQDADDDVLKITPQISAGEEALDPSITFTTKIKPDQERDSRYFSFSLVASSQPSLSEADDLANAFALDGGDINLDVGFTTDVPKAKGLAVEFDAAYSLFSADEIAPQGDSSIEVDSEILSFRASAAYKFQAATLSYSHRYHQAIGSGSETQFGVLIDDKTSYVFSVTVPVDTDSNKFLLSLERAKVQGVDEAEFRVSIAARM